MSVLEQLSDPAARWMCMVWLCGCWGLSTLFTGLWPISILFGIGCVASFAESVAAWAGA